MTALILTQRLRPSASSIALEKLEGRLVITMVSSILLTGLLCLAGA